MIISPTLCLQRMTSLTQSSSLPMLEASVPDSQENLICLPSPAPALNKYTASTGGLPSDPPSVSAYLPVWLLTGRWDHDHTQQAPSEKVPHTPKTTLNGLHAVHLLTSRPEHSFWKPTREIEQANLYLYACRAEIPPAWNSALLWALQCPNYWWLTGSIFWGRGQITALLYTHSAVSQQNQKNVNKDNLIMCIALQREWSQRAGGYATEVFFLNTGRKKNEFCVSVLKRTSSKWPVFWCTVSALDGHW